MLSKFTSFWVWSKSYLTDVLWTCHCGKLLWRICSLSSLFSHKWKWDENIYDKFLILGCLWPNNGPLKIYFMLVAYNTFRVLATDSTPAVEMYAKTASVRIHCQLLGIVSVCSWLYRSFYLIVYLTNNRNMQGFFYSFTKIWFLNKNWAFDL